MEADHTPKEPIMKSLPLVILAAICLLLPAAAMAGMQSSPNYSINGGSIVSGGGNAVNSSGLNNSGSAIGQSMSIPAGGIGSPNYKAEVVAIADPATMIAVSATAITRSGFTANWNATNGAAGYRLDVATDSGFTAFVTGYGDLGTANVTTYLVAGLNPATTYFYRVRAIYNNGETGVNSNTIVITTSPASVNGVCGAANAQTFTRAPAAALCSAGSASPISGSGPWSWACSGTNGGTDAGCSAAAITGSTRSALQVTTGSDGKTIGLISETVTGATLTLPSGTQLYDADGVLITGTLIVSATAINNAADLSAKPAAALTSDGLVLATLGNAISITITSGSSTVKTITPPMTVTMAIPSSFALPGAAVSYYSYDGTIWRLEGTVTVKANGTVDILIGHLSIWAVATFRPAIDTVAPVITSFSIPTPSTTAMVSGITITTTDTFGVTGYLLSESSTPPAATDPSWTAAVPAAYTFKTWGNHTLYAYAKDAAGNISAAVAKLVYIGISPENDGVIVPTTDGSIKTEPALADALKALDFAMKITIPTAAEQLHCDVAPLVNGVPQPDGKINLGDVIVILRRVIGL